MSARLARPGRVGASEVKGSGPASGGGARGGGGMAEPLGGPSRAHRCAEAYGKPRAALLGERGPDLAVLVRPREADQLRDLHAAAGRRQVAVVAQAAEHADAGHDAAGG